MKQLHISFLLTVLMSMVGAKAFAHDIAVANDDGVMIYYNYTNGQSELEVTYQGSFYSTYSNEYSGKLIIPEDVTYNGITRKVTSIGASAFRSCTEMVSVVIPNSVTAIGSYAFYGCSLKSLIIGPGVLTIGSNQSSPTKVIWLTNTPPSNYSNLSGTKNYVANDQYTSLNSKTVYPFLSSIFVVDGIRYVPVSPSDRTCDALDCIYDSSAENIHIGPTIVNQGILLTVRTINDYTCYQNPYIKDVEISIDGVVGSYAFSGCSSINRVVLSNNNYIAINAFENIFSQFTASINNIGVIGSKAFYNSTGLKTLEIGPNVTNINSEAFSGCSGLNSAIINNHGVLNEKAFYNCSSMQTALIGEQVTSIGSYTFGNCSMLQTITIPNAVASLGTYAFSGCSAMQSVRMGSGVRGISERVFYGCSALSDMQIGDSVSYIDPYAFANCSSLPIIRIPQSVTMINNYAFSGCTSLHDVYMDDKTTEEDDTNLGNWTSTNTAHSSTSSNTYTIAYQYGDILSFDYWVSSESGYDKLIVTLDGSTIVTQSGEQSGSYSKMFTSVGIATLIVKYTKDSSTSNGSDQARVSNIFLKHDGSLFLSSNGLSPLFVSCPLDSVYIGRNINYNMSSSNGYSPFYRNTSLRSVVITDKETEISENEFYGCTNLKNVYIGDGVESIGNWAFSGCSNLDYFAFGTALKAIGKEAFSDCTAITHIISHAATPPACGTEALDDINKWTCMLQVPTGFVDVYKAADQWKEFFFVNGGSEVVVDETPKDGDVIESAGSDGQTIYYKVINNGTELEVIYRGEKPDSYNEYSGKVVIPETVEYKGKSYSVTSIGKYAFYGCNGITSVSIPVSIKQIDISSFNKGMDSFKEFHVASIESWCNIEFTRIGFSGNHPLELARHLFVNDEEVTNLVIPNTVTAINYAAFWGCYGITSVTIPNSVKTIDDYSFANCKNITSLNIGNSVDSIGRYAFRDCSGLKTVHCFAETVPSTNSEAFEGTPISNVYLYVPASPVSLLDSYKATSPWKDFGHILAEGTTVPQNGDKIAVPNADGVTIYYEVTSDGWVNVTYRGSSWSEYTNEYTGTITIPATVTYNNVTYEVNGIGVSAFRGCTGLVSLTFEGHVAFFNKYAFVGATGLKELVLSESQRTAFTFSNNRMFDECYKTNTILYVPEAKVAAFSTNEIGTCFKAVMSLESREIISVDDNNVLVVEHLTGKNNNQVVLPVGLKNDKQITGLQFDLYLPEGMTVATNARGKMLIEATDRMDGNFSISSNTIGNFVRVTGYSPDGDAFTGNEGDILNITLNIGEDVADGDYTVRIKDIVLSDVTNTEYHPADIGATVTVKSYVIGDVDNSGAININDVVCIINYILNKSNGTFIAEAADVDGSGTININDVVTLINRYILMKGNAPSLIAKTLRRAMADDNYLHLANITIKPGETQEVQLLMTNTNEAKAIQGNIKLPAGLSFVTKSNGRLDVKNVDSRSEDFTLSCAIQNDGSMTFAHYSADGFAYEGSEGGIFTFKIKADEDAAAGTYDVVLSDVVISIDGVGYDIPNRTSTLTVTGTSGISLTSDSSSEGEGKWYTLNGQKLNGKPTQKGVYIQSGKKVVIK